MFFTKFEIIDLRNQKARTFDFIEGVNIITSSINKGGKSSVLKSLYYALGVTQKNFKPEWNYKDMLFVVYYSHEDKEGIIARKGEKFFFVGENEGQLILKDNIQYSRWFLDLVKLHIKAPFKGNESEMRSIYAEALWAIFYIDQDVSLSGSLYTKTINNFVYATGVYPKKIMEYCLGLKSILNLEKTESLLNEKKKYSLLESKLGLLGDLQPDFIKNTVSLPKFNEKDIKKNIESYLQVADKLTKKISIFQSNIYSNRVKLDSLKIERNELKSIIKQSDELYKKYSRGLCKTCKSPVYEEYAEDRISLDSNVIAIKEMIASLDRDILQIKNEIKRDKELEIISKEEYEEVTTLLEKQKGQLTLGEYLELSVNAKLNEKYFSVVSNIQNDMEQSDTLISKLIGEIKSEESKEGKRKTAVSGKYSSYLNELSKKYSISLAENDKKFLNFSAIKNSGVTHIELQVLYYMVYSQLLLDYGVIELPFGIDTVIKDDFTDESIKNLYMMIKDVLFSSGRQVFFVALKHRLQLLEDLSDCNVIVVDKDRTGEPGVKEWVLSSDEYNAPHIQNIIKKVEASLYKE